MKLIFILLLLSSVSNASDKPLYTDINVKDPIELLKSMAINNAPLIVRLKAMEFVKDHYVKGVFQKKTCIKYCEETCVDETKSKCKSKCYKVCVSD